MTRTERLYRIDQLLRSHYDNQAAPHSLLAVLAGLRPLAETFPPIEELPAEPVEL